MKYYFWLIVLLANTLLFFSCSKSREDKLPEGQVGLKPGECISERNNIKVCFQKLITESRCPEGAVCVWQGYAMAQFLFTNGQQAITFNLSTLNAGQFHSDTIIGNTKISLIDIIPYPSLIKRNQSATQVIIELK